MGKERKMRDLTINIVTEMFIYVYGLYYLTVRAHFTLRVDSGQD